MKLRNLLKENDATNNLFMYQKGPINAILDSLSTYIPKYFGFKLVQNVDNQYQLFATFDDISYSIKYNIDNDIKVSALYLPKPYHNNIYSIIVPEGKDMFMKIKKFIMMIKEYGDKVYNTQLYYDTNIEKYLSSISSSNNIK